MIIALTGTPGTGKTSVAEELDKSVLDITEFLEKKDLGEKKDGEIEIDPEKLVDALSEEIDDKDDIVIEGHLAHHFPADVCVVLRCRPDVLRERLSQRDYSDEKVEENVDAEAMDLILSEAVSEHERVIEIDTTGREPVSVADEIEEKIESEDFEVGVIDWSEFL